MTGMQLAAAAIAVLAMAAFAGHACRRWIDHRRWHRNLKGRN